MLGPLLVGHPELCRWHYRAKVYGVTVVIAILLHLCGMATLGGHTNWSQASSVGTCTAMSSRKVNMCKIAPLSLLLNTPLSGSSQQSLVQEAASSTPVSSQNTLTSGETPTSRSFPFGHCHR